jgi:hypothetical protein
VGKLSTVNYGDQWFWAYDVSLGVFLKYLIDVAQRSPQANEPWLSELVRGWRLSACITDVGLYLENDWTPEQRRCFVEWAYESCNLIGQRSAIPAAEMLAWRVLDDEGIFPRSTTEVPTAPIVELGKAIIRLISGDRPGPIGKDWIYGWESRPVYFPDRC